MNLDEMINIKYNALNHSDRHIWKCINQDRGACAKMTIEELAARCSVSRTTILRFAKKLGLEGYTELRYCLRRESLQGQDGEDGLIDLNGMLKNYMVMLGNLKDKCFDGACELIEAAGRIVVVSTGTAQYLAAQELARSFLKIGVVMTVVMGGTELVWLPGLLGQEDLVIIISVSGESPSGVSLARALKSRGIPILSITRQTANSVSDLADEAVYVYSEKVFAGKREYYESITMFYTAAEILFVKYYNYLQNKKGDG